MVTSSMSNRLGKVYVESICQLLGTGRELLDSKHDFCLCMQTSTGADTCGSKRPRNIQRQGPDWTEC